MPRDRAGRLGVSVACVWLVVVAALDVATRAWATPRHPRRCVTNTQPRNATTKPGELLVQGDGGS